MITLIVPTLNKKKATKTAVAAVESSGCADYVKTIVSHDKDSTGFTRTVNRGLAKAGAGHVCILNDDSVMSAGWLSVLLLEMSRRERVWFSGPSGACRTRPQNSGRRGDSRRPKIVTHLAGFCLLIHPSGVEYLDDRFIHYGSDVYLQFRASERGGRSLWVPGVFAKHELHAPLEKWWGRDQEVLKHIWRK